MTARSPLRDTDLRIGAPTGGPGADGRLGRVIALIGDDVGRYPHGTSLLVHGPDETLLVDPSLSVSARGGAPLPVDRMLVSHSHEDHLAGVHLYPDAALHAHHDDVIGLQSLEGFKKIYGMPRHVEETWIPQMVEEFHYTERADASGFADGHVFDLGGGMRCEVVHLPGHTRGHCGFLVEPDGVFFVADVDLSSFGPYYGDHWSDLEDFERSIERCRDIDARWYVTFHHKGVVEGRQEFLRQLDDFAAVIGRREQRLLDLLAEPRTIEDVVAHRLVYRPGVQLAFADHVEHNTARMHLERLERQGAVVRLPTGQWRQA